MPIVALLTDFGLKDTYVAEMKAVLMSGGIKNLEIVDLTHQVSSFDIESGAFQLWRSYRHFPKGTAFLCVVDPGVGSERRGIYVKSKHLHFVGPDNGLMTWAIRDIESIEGRAKYFQIPIDNATQSTFHGRDIFAPFVRELFNRRTSKTAVLSIQGGSLPIARRLKPHLMEGQVIEFDHYGNCVTNLSASLGVDYVELGKRQIRSAPSYSAITPGEVALVKGSHGLWEVAAREESAAKRLGAKKGDRVLAFLL